MATYRMLTNVESDLIPSIKKLLRKAKGPENAITSKMIVEVISERYPDIRIDDVRIRRIINYMRINQTVKNLLASSRGYFIERDPERVRAYVISLRVRAKNVMMVANSYSTK